MSRKDRKDLLQTVATYVEEVEDLLLVMLRDGYCHTYKEIAHWCLRTIRPEVGSRRYQVTRDYDPDLIGSKTYEGQLLLMEDALASLQHQELVIVHGKRKNKRKFQLAESADTNRTVGRKLNRFANAEKLVRNEFRGVLADGRWHRFQEKSSAPLAFNLYAQLRNAAGPGVPYLGAGVFVHQVVEQMVADGECTGRSKKDNNSWNGVTREYRLALSTVRKPELTGHRGS